MIRNGRTIQAATTASARHKVAVLRLAQSAGFHHLPTPFGRGQPLTFVINVKNFTNFSCGRGAQLLKNVLNFDVRRVKQIRSGSFNLFLQ